ncbi:hypothetical protein Rs2_26001 [Raphanus sativus]|nr:hypothetical protein Rs2_26001 [Raphanus sativus]
MSSTEMYFFLFTSPPRYLSSFSMNSSQACFFHSPLRTISLSRPSYGFFSKRDPSLCYQPFRSKSYLTTSLSLSRTRETSFTQMNRKHLYTKERKSFSISYSDKHRDESTGSDEMHTDALDVETIPLESQSSQNSGVRVGYFIPLPGFDRRLIPQDYLSFVSGSVEELGEFGAEIKLSLFQLGLSP